MGRWVVRPAPSEVREHGDVVAVLTNKERIMFKKMFFLLALCLMAVGASADDGRRVFQLSAGEEYSQFVELLKSQNGFDSGGNIKVELLSAFAYGASKQRGFVPASVSDEKGFPIFDRAFRTENGFGNTVTVSAFREKGTTGNGILIPPKEVLAVAFAKMQTPAVQAVSDDSATKALAILNGNLQKMKDEVAKERREGKKVAGLEGQINALKDQVVELGMKQSGFASSATLKAETDRISGEISAIQKAMNDSATGLSALGGKVTGMDGRVSAVETSLIQQYGVYAIGAIGLATILLALGYFGNRRRCVEAKNSASGALEVGDAAHKAVLDVIETVEAHDERLLSAEDKLSPGNTLRLTADEGKALKMMLESLAAGEEHVEFCEMQDGTRFKVLVFRADGDYVTIKGIVDQEEDNFIKIKNVPTRLRRAARDKKFTTKWTLAVAA